MSNDFNGSETNFLVAEKTNESKVILENHHLTRISLQKTLDLAKLNYFLNCVSKKLNIDKNHFESSLSTNQLIFDIKNTPIS